MNRMTDKAMKSLAKVFDSAKAAEASLKMYIFHQDGSQEEKLLLKRNAESHLSNLLMAIDANGPFFKKLEFEKFKAVTQMEGKMVDAATIPPGFDNDPRPTLKKVLRNARHWDSHPEQAGIHGKKEEINNERDRYIADRLDMKLLFELFNSISDLLGSVSRNLNEDERCALYAYSDRSRSEVFGWQQEVSRAIKAQEDLFAAHPELLEQALSFLTFQPNASNVHIIHEDGQTSEVND